MKKVLNQFGWLMKKNSIGKTVPEYWQKLAEVNAVALSKLFRDAKVEVMLNTNQAFVYFYPQESVVVALKKQKEGWWQGQVGYKGWFHHDGHS